MFQPLRSRWPALLCLFLTAAGSPAQDAEFKPAAPDPLFQDRVALPLTAASLHVRLESGLLGLVGWEFFKACQDLSDAQLRTLANDLARRSRHGSNNQAMESMAGVVNAVMDSRSPRSIRDVVQEKISRLEWKDGIPEISGLGDSYDPFLLDRLAAEDLTAALELADGIRNAKTRKRVLMDGAEPAKTVTWLVDRAATTGGIEAARAAVARLEAGPRRYAAEARLAIPGYADVSARKRASAKAVVRPSFENEPQLARLASLVSPDLLDPPFPLLNEIRKLSPAEATRLAQAGGSRLQERSVTWLRWGLLWRASDADPDAALALMQPDDAAFGRMLPAVLYARLVHRPGMEQTLRSMPAGDMRDAAVMGYLSAASLHDPARLIALAKDLSAPTASWKPLLIRLTRNGAAPLALKLARNLPESDSLFDSFSIESDIMRVWALTDLNAAIGSVTRRLRDMKELGDKGEGISEAFAFLPARQVLESLDVPTIGALSEQEIIRPAFWLYLATEDIDAGFQFFERAKWSLLREEARKSFASVAAKYQPERAKALLKATVPRENDKE